MESAAISEFIESTYPNPPIQLHSPLGDEIISKATSALGPALRVSILPREMTIISPRAQDWFRKTREAALGHRLEDLLNEEKEEKLWKDVQGDFDAVGDLLQTNQKDGPFVMGSSPSYIDFWVVGSLQLMKVVDERSFERFKKHPAYMRLYEACAPFLEKQD